MGRSLIRRCCLGIFLLAAPQLGVNAEDAGATDQHRGVDAKLLKRQAPEYPRTELRRGRQGWVQLSYVVTAEGEIIDPVVEKSSGSHLFEKAALRGVKQWTYEPATWDGVPIQQCQTKMMVSFAIEGEETEVTRKFYRRYKKVDKSLAADDIPKAQKLIDGIDGDLNLSLSETAWLWALRARLAGQVGDKDAQLKALRRATKNDGRWIDEELYPNLLFVRTVLEIEKGNFSEALSVHKELTEIDENYPQLDKIEPYVNQIREWVASDRALSVRARIGSEENCTDCATNWHYKPLRRRVSIAGVEGSLRKIEFRCSWQRVIDKAAEGATWDLPQNWGDCSVIVFGEPGTTFNLLELPSA